MSPSQQRAMQEAQAASEQQSAETARGRERMTKLLDDLGEAALEGEANPERAERFDREFDEV